MQAFTFFCYNQLCDIKVQATYVSCYAWSELEDKTTPNAKKTAPTAIVII